MIARYRHLFFFCLLILSGLAGVVAMGSQTVHAQPTQVMCSNGELINYTPSVAGTSCEARFGAITVDNAAFHRCNDYPTPARRAGCLANLFDNDGIGAPGTRPVMDLGSNFGTNVCGTGDSAVRVAVNIGCRGVGNPITDALFAIIRFLSVGVGVVIVASTVVAGIQYSASRADPGAVAKAITRIRNNVTALLLYIFAYAILNWIVPGGLFVP